ncbi:hypothetical protein VTJ49DRAFT_515 [Mycothermus thermophilus]|uniref:Major facilitator superfamily (MFS) profile domain-containing protein n=1 Tax=Humicola insolens TaxID=85995 RepID=A0ABR3VEX5_HUMIN
MTLGTDNPADTQPLLQNTTNQGYHNVGYSSTNDSTTSLTSRDTNSVTNHDTSTPETITVDFNPDGDPDNPLDWPTPFKWAIVSMLAFMAFTVTMSCISLVPLATTIVADLSPSPTTTTSSASVLLVTIWELGEAAGPLLIAPLSERLGRLPVFHGAHFLFIFSGILAATTTTTSSSSSSSSSPSGAVTRFILLRMLSGLAVAANVLNPAVVGDLFARDERGAALSLTFLAPLVGGALGPAVGSAVAERWGWRAVVWMNVALAAVGEGMFLVGFRETYKVAILRRRKEKLEVEAEKVARAEGKGVPRFRTVFEQQEDRGGRLRDEILRPAIVLCGSGVLMLLSLYGSVIFSYYYVYSTTFSTILLEVYKLSPVTVGSCFCVFSAGSVLSVCICNRFLDRIYRRMTFLHKGVGRPEFRLPLSVVGGFLMPLAVATYGWAAQLRLSLLILLFSVCAIGAAMMLALIPVMAYVVDAFGLYAASAMTGVIVTRCLMSTFLPLTTVPLIGMFGYGWAFTVFAVGSLLLAPIPLVMLRYGERWRRFSRYTREA